MSKVVAINGSPRMEKGYTYMILTPFLQGMKDAGADVEVQYASRLQVEPCTGEFQCWYGKNAGECYIDDDMQMLYATLRPAETLVLATPVYIPLPGAQALRFLDERGWGADPGWQSGSGGGEESGL